MAINYQQYMTTMQTMLVIPTDNVDNNFLTILPRMIEYAELRIYRELDFLSTLASQTTALTANNRNCTLPSNVIVPQSMNVITPVGAASADAGTRNPLQRLSIEMVNALYPATGTATVPKFFAVIGAPTISTTITAGAYTILVAPTPDAAYKLEVVGTVRPTPLSAANTTTFITNNLPDLFIAASMVFGTGYQQNFGAQSDNPQMAGSWEAQFQALKIGVNIEELRRKAESVSWEPYMPSPIANQQRERSGGA